MKEEELKFKLALTLIPHVGPALAKNLLSYCGSPQAVFLENKSRLTKIPGVGEISARSITAFKNFHRVEQEIEFIRNKGIKALFYTDKEYPQRLKRQFDCPMMLYYQGTADLNHYRIINLVGTRRSTDYGRQWCKKFIEDIKPLDCVVISGLAYGIDIAAHKACVESGVPTIGVLAHGLDRMYPPSHKNTATEMIKNGGLLTEYISETNPDRENFPTRNRIVAGMSDATIVVESALKGGAVITANIAHSYNRDVFAVPGKTGDAYSAGCNHLIKSNKAALLENAQDLEYYMGWDRNIAEEKKAIRQQALPFDLDEVQKEVMQYFERQLKWNIDDLAFETKLTGSELALSLLELELKGLIRSLPGKVYQVAN